MSEVTITTNKSALAAKFNQIKEVYYLKTPNQEVSALATFDMELPVLSEGVTFDTGTADITKIKLTTGDIWAAYGNPGEADIKFQVPSIAGPINELMLDKKQTSSAMVSTLDAATYEGAGYSTAPKKITGALFLRSEDRETCIYLPNVEGFANLVVESGKPAYFNVSFSPLGDTHDASIYLLTKQGA